MDGRSSPLLVTPVASRKVPEMIPNGEVDGIIKIHHIRLNCSAVCILSHVISPSCIWIKPFNHVTDRLQVRDLNELKKCERINQYSYVMAPIEEGVYARARIMKQETFVESETGEEECFVHVLFIDEGSSKWVSSDCLAEMNPLSIFHPWQAIPVCLFKVRPVDDNTISKPSLIWSEDVIASLKRVLEEFNYLRAAIVFNSKKIQNDYNDIAKVNLYGMHSISDEGGKSIAHLFARHVFGKVSFDRNLYDADQQKLYLCHLTPFKGAESLKPWELDLVKPHVLVNENELITTSNIETSLKWGKTIEVPPITIDKLNELDFCNKGEYVVQVEGRHTISPFEFYARPLHVEKLEKMPPHDEHEEIHAEFQSLDGTYLGENAMLVANEKLLFFANELNQYYGCIQNQRHINTDHTKTCLEHGFRVYGIVQIEDDFSQYTGVWQRVEIVASKEVGNHERFYTIRFLDLGGTAIKPSFKVFEIHPRHCDKPPMCLQLCLYGVQPTGKDGWPEEARKFFYRELRDDVPISLNIVGQAKKPASVTHTSIAFHRLDVFFVNCLQIRDGSTETIDSRLIRKGYASGAVDYPVPLI